MIKSEGRDGGNDGEEAGISRSDEFIFDQDGFGPGVEAVLLDLDVVATGQQVELVVGDGGELVVDDDSG